MQAELIDDLGGIASFEDEWRDLAELRGNGFITPEWFRAWWSHRPASISPLIAVVRHPDRSLAAVFPFVLDSQRRPRAIRFAGATWGDLFGPATRLEDEAPAAAAVMAALEAEGLDRNILNLDHVNEDARWWPQMQSSATKRQAKFEQQRFEVPHIDLTGLDWDGYLASRSRNFRQQLRQRERRLREQHEVEIRTATEETLELDLAHIFTLHERRWAGRGNSSLNTPGVVAFLTEFSRAIFRNGWLRLRLLEADGVPVAAFLGWRLGDVYAFYQSGFDPAWAPKSVGTVLMADTIRSAIDEGAGTFDLLLGAEAYKQRFANDSHFVETIFLTRAMRLNTIPAYGEAWARRNLRDLVDRPGLERVSKALRHLLPTTNRF
jgi:CelD/BcsL family acetyltransferase involved in cellulose biosynthesis